MAIANRELDASEKKKTFSASIGSKLAPNVTAATMVLGVVPFPSELAALTVVGYGLSAAPQGELRTQRFIAGSGFTLIAMGVSFIIPAMGVSGPLNVSLPASGNSLIQMLQGDQLVVYTGVANSSTDTFVAGWALKALQDIRADFGSAT